MAFQTPTLHRQVTQQDAPASSTADARQDGQQHNDPSDSQEWILFAPASQTQSSSQRTATTQTAGLSRASDLGYLHSHNRTGPLGSSILEDDITEDAELDSLDDGLHAFREPALYPYTSHGTNGPVLPAHDGLGSFQASSGAVLEQLWQHEQFNAKRKHEGHHRRPSSVLRHLDTIDELEAQASEEKRMRIEKWRIEQSQVLLEEVEREARRTTSKAVRNTTSPGLRAEDALGTTPKQRDYVTPSPSKPATQIGLLEEGDPQDEPFWRRITRRFIRDIIGIDEPLLSVILGESLPGEATPRASSPVPQSSKPSLEAANDDEQDQSHWRDRLLHRIAHELGVFPSQLTPHPGAFASYTAQTADYAGMPIAAPRPIPAHKSEPSILGKQSAPLLASSLGPNFPPTLRDDAHAESWGYEEDSALAATETSIDLKKEREYWEKELDVRMVFRYLKSKFSQPEVDTTSLPQLQQLQQQRTLQPRHPDNTAQRVAIIRQHHPLVNGSQRPSQRHRRDSRLASRRPGSSCASESARGSRKSSVLRSGSSRNYWDIGGSVGSGSLLAGL